MNDKYKPVIGLEIHPVKSPSATNGASIFNL